MSNASQTTIPACNHERRPGTTVCLHCRHAARLAAGQRRKKLLLRGSAVAIVIGVVAVIGSFSTNALIGRFSRKSAANDVPVQVVASASAPTTSQSDSIAAPTNPVVQQGDATANASAIAPLIPVIPLGQSTLRDSVAAMRTDSAVMLSFDLPMLRTRMPVKFEIFLRSTLHQIYGKAIDSTLAGIPDGAIASQGDLIAELPTRGIHIPVNDGWRLDVFPEIRPGQDGPLVVRYRAAVVKP